MPVDGTVASVPVIVGGVIAVSCVLEMTVTAVAESTGLPPDPMKLTVVPA